MRVISVFEWYVSGIAEKQTDKGDWMWSEYDKRIIRNE
jgi:hypothetical protein